MPHCEKTFSTRINTNQTVQAQKMVRGLKFWIYKVEGLYYLYSEIKDADQPSSRYALLFLYMSKAGFLMMHVFSKSLKTGFLAIYVSFY